MKILPLNVSDKIDEIVDIHMQSFTGFFLTFLGRGFLKQLYKGFIEHPESGLIVAEENNKTIGFLAYSNDLSGFYKYLIKKKLLSFAWYSVYAFFRNPKIMFRLLRAFTYSNEAKRGEKYIELSSIGVLPEAEGKGAGSKMISALKTIAASSEFEYIKLETDAVNNEKANSFYKKNGFVFDSEYITREGRKMNVYLYPLK